MTLDVKEKELLGIAVHLFAADIGSRSVYHDPSDETMVKTAMKRARLLIDAVNNDTSDN